MLAVLDNRLLQAVDVALKLAQDEAEETHPFPLVLHPVKNSLHSRSVLAVLLSVQTLSLQAAAVVAAEAFQHFPSEPTYP